MDRFRLTVTRTVLAARRGAGRVANWIPRQALRPRDLELLALGVAYLVMATALLVLLAQLYTRSPS